MRHFGAAFLLLWLSYFYLISFVISRNYNCELVSNLLETMGDKLVVAKLMALKPKQNLTGRDVYLVVHAGKAKGEEFIAHVDASIDGWMQYDVHMLLKSSRDIYVFWRNSSENKLHPDPLEARHFLVPDLIGKDKQTLSLKFNEILELNPDVNLTYPLAKLSHIAYGPYGFYHTGTCDSVSGQEGVYLLKESEHHCKKCSTSRCVTDFPWTDTVVSANDSNFFNTYAVNFCNEFTEVFGGRMFTVSVAGVPKHCYHKFMNEYKVQFWNSDWESGPKVCKSIEGDVLIQNRNGVTGEKGSLISKSQSTLLADQLGNTTVAKFKDTTYTTETSPMTHGMSLNTISAKLSTTMISSVSGSSKAIPVSKEFETTTKSSTFIVTNALTDTQKSNADDMPEEPIPSVLPPQPMLPPEMDIPTGFTPATIQLPALPMHPVFDQIKPPSPFEPPMIEPPKIQPPEPIRE